eukprot:TRINITY_DN15583_c0_g1_i1.p1 TRINITY_DN15583_c0_g1~~TRINITY_DN15583_c0_g1_i1.p1  ORF type:complete len:809 (-),score=218.23 TRINITY_DN15583_c0_g1_i1:32-2410(-)
MATQALDAAISEAMPSDDPLDGSDFKAIEYINAMFPNEQSLTGLDDHMGKLQIRIMRLEESILTNVRTQGSAGDRGRQDLADARRAIHELDGKVKGIQDRALAAEHMVQELSRDIRTLDHAKRNLTNTITALNQLHMLVSSVEQLRQLASDKQYDRAAELVNAVTDLSTAFDAYADVPKVNALRKDVAENRNLLRRQVVGDLQLYILGSDNVSQSVVTDACRVVDALGPDVRDQVVSLIMDTYLLEYGNEFPQAGDTLERADMRFRWIQQGMIVFDKRYKGVLPEEWDTAAAVATRLCEVTRERLTSLLDLAGDEVNMDTLVKLMTRGRDLEKFLNKCYGTPPAESAELQKPHHRLHSRSSRMTLSTSETGESGEVRKRFSGAVSSGFERAMTQYVRHQEVQMNTAVNEFIRDEVWETKSNTEPAVSARDLIFVIRRYLNMCSDITTRQPLFDLSRVFANTLAKYGDGMAAQIGSATGKIAVDEEFTKVLLIVRTAEYCTITTEKLADVVRDKVDAAFRDHVNFDVASDSFGAVQTKGVQSILNGLEKRLESHLSVLSKTDWSQFSTSTDDGVRDESAYIQAIVNILKEVVSAASQGLSLNYYKHFCDKVSNTVVAKYRANLYKCTKINPEAAQQLLLDAQTLKAKLLELPCVTGVLSVVPPMYRKFVERDMSKVEAILKLINYPAEMLADSFHSMLKDLDGNVAELKKIMELRNMKKSEQTPVLEAYQKMADVHDDGSAAAAAAPVYAAPAELLRRDTASDLKTQLEKIENAAPIRAIKDFFSRTPGRKKD